MIKAMSMFSGCGGLDCGMERAGFFPVAFVDFDAACRETLRLNYPNTPCFENVFDPEIEAAFKIHRPQVIYGGPPCQPFSTMGKRRYFEDERGKALLRYVKLITTLLPRAFLMENVQGLANANNGDLLASLIKRVSRAGYKVSWRVVNASNYGVPQHRKRLVMMGSLKSTIDIPESIIKVPVSLRTAIETLPATSDGVQYPSYLQQVMPLIPEGGNWRNLPPTLQRKIMGNANKKSGGLCGYGRKLSFDAPSPTLLTSPIQRATLLGHPIENRPLNIAEYQRIQCFPDSWKLAGNTQDKYRQLGNAVPVTLAYELGKLLKKGL